jgi:two-component system cell cycle sensor histidine kinase PleC
MAADYVLTVLILRDYAGYTPFETLCVAALVTVPITYALVNSHFKLRKALGALAISRDVAVEANLKKTQFFANVSHELRTPLNAILGFSELLGLDIFAGKRVEYARLIHDSGAHLLALVNDLLDLSRIEAGKFELHDEAVFLRDVAQECRDTVAPRLHSGKLSLTLTFPADLLCVVGDRRAFKQILLNLLTNAIKFTAPGGSIDVFAGVTVSGELMFGVRDEGIGIAEQDQVKVFERFGQGPQDVASFEQGTGLGLPIVKGLAEAHGGRVTMESHSGSGTCVTVWLPADRLEPSLRIVAKAS